MLGIPSADRDRFSEWSAVLARGLDPEFLMPDDALEQRMAVVGAFAEYFFPLLAERRAAPGDDLLSQLVLAEEAGVALTEGQTLATAILLLVAGHETTVNLISGGLLALVRHPDQMARWRAEPELPTAVDELLRFVSPVQLTGRVMLEDVDLGPATLPRGHYVLTVIASANHDREAFDAPEVLDLARRENRHLGFGFGLHHCLGAPLARLETSIALPRLLERARDIELVADEVSYRDNVVLRGLAELPVRVSAA